MSNEKHAGAAESKTPQISIPEGSQLPIRWDDSHAATTSANAFKISGSRDAVVVKFGTATECDADGHDQTIQLMNRIVMNPPLAQQLHTGLSGFLQEYESRFGAIEAGAGGACRAAQPAKDTCATPGRLMPETADQGAASLIQLIQNLNVTFRHEKSFRVFEQTLLTDRFLLSVDRQDIRQDWQHTILHLCRQLEMPDQFFEATARDLGAAKAAHFGFEEDRGSQLFKVYLEFGSPIDTGNTMAANCAVSTLEYLAFKWDAQNNARRIVTKYTWFPHLSVEDMLRRMSSIYQSGGQREAFNIAKGVLEIAAGRMNHDDIRYLEVTEEDSERRSYDLNLYDADLKIMDVHSLLLQMCQLVSIPSERFKPLYDEIQTTRLGHFAGGVHRDNQEFFNVYFGGVMSFAADAGRSAPETETPFNVVRTTDSGVDAKLSQSYLDRLEYTTEQDQYFNYCWWPYNPVAAVEGKFRPVNLLFQSFDLAGLDDRAFQLVQIIRNSIGAFRTVYGIKWLGDRLAWEFYIYDYQRTDRDVSITKVLEAIEPIIRCDVRANENLPYFMFSFDIDQDLVTGARGLDVVHMYVGNPGSAVSSGIAYALTSRNTTLENFYFFFDAKKELSDAADKICSSAYVDKTKIDVDKILRPELARCQTICIANKQQNDTAYFSGVDLEQLLFFLKWLSYPQEIVAFVEENRQKLDHLLYDVGFDYRTDGDDIVILKSGYYGVF
jgi:hypothetical protein